MQLGQSFRDWPFFCATVGESLRDSHQPQPSCEYPPWKGGATVSLSETRTNRSQATSLRLGKAELRYGAFASNRFEKAKEFTVRPTSLLTRRFKTDYFPNEPDVLPL